MYNSWSLSDELNPTIGLKSYEHQENTIYNSIQFDYNYNSTHNTPDYFVGATNDKYVIIIYSILFINFHI